MKRWRKVGRLAAGWGLILGQLGGCVSSGQVVQDVPEEESTGRGAEGRPRDLALLEDQRHNAQSVLIAGAVAQVQRYCGGAQPSEEILRDLTQPKPVVGERFAVRAGDRNVDENPVVARFATGERGGFEIWLPPGRYCLVEEPRLGGASLISPFDQGEITQCLMEEARTCLFVWEQRPGAAGAPLDIVRAQGCGSRCFPTPPRP